MKMIELGFICLFYCNGFCNNELVYIVIDEYVY